MSDESRKATRQEARERISEPIEAEQDNSQYGIIGTPDQYEELPFEDES